MVTSNYPWGHSVLKGYMSLRPQDPDTLAYEAVLKQKYGEVRAEEILAPHIHHVICFPVLSLQPLLQQLRAIRPLAVDRTLTEIWHFRLKGAPEPMYWRARLFQPGQLALDHHQRRRPLKLPEAAQGFMRRRRRLGEPARYAGQDDESAGVIRTRMGTSEAPLRNYYQV